MATINVDPKDKLTVNRRTSRIIVSFKLMRLTVGILGLIIGILLPIVTGLFSECNFLQESISHYYYTVAGGVFVGLVCAIGFFLFMYPGEGKWEDIWLNIAGVCAVIIALFPTAQTTIDMSCVINHHEYADWVSSMHLWSAALFFIILGLIAIFQFPKLVNPNEQASTRKKRNIFYRICGVVMITCVLIMAPMVGSDAYAKFLSENKYVFTLEVIALVAFGLCWLVQGMLLNSVDAGSIDKDGID